MRTQSCLFLFRDPVLFVVLCIISGLLAHNRLLYVTFKVRHVRPIHADNISGAINWTFAGVQECVSEGHGELCFWCNRTFTADYPLKHSQHFERSFLAGGPCSMPPAILAKLHTGVPVRIVTVGGSMTAGHGCINGAKKGQTCAWPQRMQERLLQVLPRANITVTNMAVPGHDYTAALSSGRVHNAIKADVLIVDLQVNSQVRVVRNSMA